MKKSISILLSLALTIFCCPNYANATYENNYNGYIVKYKQTGLRLFSADEGSLSNIILVTDKNKLDMSKVEFMIPNRKLELLTEPYVNDTFAYWWNYATIKAKSAWDIGACGNNVKVGIIDIGLASNHPDMNYNNVLLGRNYYSDQYGIHINENTDDSGWHGTFVTGIIGAVSNNAIGIPGLADSVKIIPLKYDLSLYALLRAIEDAVDVFNCDVINISSGGAYKNVLPGSLEETEINLMQTTIDYAISKGAIIVAAAGNGALFPPDTVKDYTALFYPAACNGVIGVGATNSSNGRAYFSQMNTSVFVVAPGESIKSIYKSTSGYAYGAANGTSFSAPHITAMAAVAKNIKKDLTLTEFKQLLKDSSTDLGVVGYDTSYGWGLPDFEKMINKLLENRPLFVSDVRTTSDNNGSLKIYNNSQSQFLATSILAKYGVNNLLSADVKNINLSPSQKETINFGSLNKIKHFLFENFTNIRPEYGTIESSN